MIGRSSAILQALATLAVLFSAPAHAQDRVYERGSVWSITYVRALPGKFDAYMDELRKVYSRIAKRNISDGRMLSYKILSVVAARDNEPNVIILGEFPNWAVLDIPDPVWDQAMKEVFANIGEAADATVSRGRLRDLRGELHAQEILLKPTD